MALALLLLCAWQAALLMIPRLPQATAGAFDGAGWILKQGGSRPQDYAFFRFPWHHEELDGAIQANRDANRGPTDYAALFYEVDASQARGHRVRLGSQVTAIGVEQGAWAGLFVRVDSRDGRVLAFDNMRNRPITSTARQTGTYEVVVQVPGPPLQDPDNVICPVPDQDWNAAATIVVGVFLCGGRGTIQMSSSYFLPVSQDVPLTQLPSPIWQGPGLPDSLGPGYK